MVYASKKKKNLPTYCINTLNHRSFNVSMAQVKQTLCKPIPSKQLLISDQKKTPTRQVRFENHQQMLPTNKRLAMRSHRPGGGGFKPHRRIITSSFCYSLLIVRVMWIWYGYNYYNVVNMPSAFRSARSAVLSQLVFDRNDGLLRWEINLSQMLETGQCK